MKSDRFENSALLVLSAAIVAVGDAMISGFALAAAPAQHRVTGVKTFIVGPDGVVYEKDLGPETLKAFEKMDRYNPDKTWKPTDDQWSEEEEASAE